MKKIKKFVLLLDEKDHAKIKERSIVDKRTFKATMEIIVLEGMRKLDIIPSEDDF